MAKAGEARYAAFDPPPHRAGDFSGISVDPSNGGPTQTMALLPGSPAIGATGPVTTVVTDQRGVSRPFSFADIGAFQTQRSSFALTYHVGNTVSGSGFTTAPTNAGTYTVVAAFTSTDPKYGNAQSSPVTFIISPTIPTVAVTDPGGPYNGRPFPVSATATGLGGAAVGGSFTLTYYVGNAVSGSGFATAPTNAGTYTVVASFISGDANYGNARSLPVTFIISPAIPTVTATDAGGVYNGQPFPAAAAATGLSGAAVSGSFTLTYYVGNTVSGSGSSTAPTNPGTYTVVASFVSGGANYGNARSLPLTFIISPDTPMVTVTDAGGTYDGQPFPASASATGLSGAAVSGSFTLTYYVGNTVSGPGLSTAPTNAGTYTVVAARTPTMATRQGVWARRR